MYVVLQHPFADFRAFLGSAAKRLRRPAWPLVTPQLDFVRSSGQVKSRALGGIEEWAGEEVYCEAKTALRFPNHLQDVPLGSPSTAASATRAFRRFHSAGTVARVEVGLHLELEIDYYAHPEIEGLHDILRNCLQLPVTLRGPNGGIQTLTLVACGPALAQHYLRASTERAGACSAKQLDSWWLSAGSPAAVVEWGSTTASGLPPHTQRVLDLKGATLSHSWLQIGPVRCSSWFIQRENADDYDALRRLRIHLLRLHAERECLKLVMLRLDEGKLDLAVDPSSSELIQQYLNDSIRAIEKPERYGIAQASLLEAAQHALGVTFPGYNASLGSMRRQVALKVDRYVRRAQATAAVTNNYISGDQMNTNIQMGNVSVSGDFNVVTAKSIQNSFNKAASADVKDDLKERLKELSIEVARLAKALPPEKAEAVARDLETLTAEAVSKQPRRKWYELSAEGLVEAAKSVSEMAAPITTAVKTVLALLAA